MFYHQWLTTAWICALLTNYAVSLRKVITYRTYLFTHAFTGHWSEPPPASLMALHKSDNKLINIINIINSEMSVTKKTLLCLSDQFFLLRCFHGTLNMVLPASIHSRPGMRPLWIRFSSHGRSSTRSRRSPGSRAGARSIPITSSDTSAASVIWVLVASSRHSLTNTNSNLTLNNTSQRMSWLIQPIHCHSLLGGLVNELWGKHANDFFSIVILYLLTVVE